MNDFTGFTFCGAHSFDDLHIVRVSNGSRYNEDLVPTFQDVTASVPGGDGQYYWESFYSNKPLPVSFAFDELTETDIRRLRNSFDGKVEGWLIFDERPYKKYWAKVQSPVQLNYICFDNDNGARVYKGEGTVNFVAYYPPYAKSIHKYLNLFSDEEYLNKGEWAESSGMKATQGSYDGTNTTSITVFNAGDIETDWMAFFPITSSGSALTSLTLTSNGVTIGSLSFSAISRKDTNDTYIRINSQTNLVEGCKLVGGEFMLTGSLYNEFVTSGDFFKIPVGGDYVFNSNTNCTKIEYEFLYY